MWKNPILILAVGAVIAGAGVVFGLGPSTPIITSVRNAVNPPTQLAGNLDATERVSSHGMALLKELDDTFAELSEGASKGVVSIASPNGGSGSGFIYRSDGYIVTNDHVVGGAKTVDVALPDGRTLKGKVTFSNDDQIDLALVKIDAKDLPSLPMADSSKVRVGQFAIAVGSPFGLDDTVTVGHVSALGRGSMVPDPRFGNLTRAYAGLIQTDAPINPGNSGGPLLNIYGEVIGVNSTIVSASNSSAGIGFSIPSNVVKAVADEMIETGKFDRGVLGAYIRELTPVEKAELKVPGGAYVEGVEPGGPSAQAGIKDHDVIVGINGNTLPTELDLRVALYKSSPGESATLDYVRDGKRLTTTIELDKPEREQPQRLAPEGLPYGGFGLPDYDELRERLRNPRPDVPVRLGISLRTADATVRKQFDLPADAKGLVVTMVDKASFAAKIGVKQGDVLIELNGENVDTVPQIAKILECVKWGDPVTVVVMRYKDGRASRITMTENIG